MFGDVFSRKSLSVVTQAHVSFFLEVSSNALAGQSSQPSVKLSRTAHLVRSQMLALVSYDLLSGDFMVHLPLSSPAAIVLNIDG